MLHPQKKFRILVAVAGIAVPLGTWGQASAVRLASDTPAPLLASKRFDATGSMEERSASGGPARLASEQNLPTTESRAQKAVQARNAAAPSTKRAPLASDLPANIRD